jgi:hypothetical protein
MERKILDYYSDDEWSDDIKFHTLNINIDTDIQCKLHHYFLLEQCIYIYDNKINKILQIFNILDKFKKIDELHSFYAVYLFIASEHDEETFKIVFEYIKHNKFNISFEDLNDVGFDLELINNHFNNDTSNKKRCFHKYDTYSVSHLSSITNLIRDNKIECLQIYHDNKLIVEDYYDDIKDSLNFFNVKKETLNFFKKNFNITK